METESQLLPLLDTLYESTNPTRKCFMLAAATWIIGKIREGRAANGPDGRLRLRFGCGGYLPALAEAFREVVRD